MNAKFEVAVRLNSLEFQRYMMPFLKIRKRSVQILLSVLENIKEIDLA